MPGAVIALDRLDARAIGRDQVVGVGQAIGGGWYAVLDTDGRHPCGPQSHGTSRNGGSRAGSGAANFRPLCNRPAIGGARCRGGFQSRPIGDKLRRKGSADKTLGKRFSGDRCPSSLGLGSLKGIAQGLVDHNRPSHGIETSARIHQKVGAGGAGDDDKVMLFGRRLDQRIKGWLSSFAHCAKCCLPSPPSSHVNGGCGVKGRTHCVMVRRFEMLRRLEARPLQARLA